MELYNIHLERAILNTIILDNSEFEKVKSILKPEDFYSPFNQIFFKTMEELLDEIGYFDENLLKGRLIEKKKFNEDEYFEILTTTPIEAVKEYAKKIKELSLKRRLEKLLKLNSLKVAEKDIFELIETLKSELEHITKEDFHKFELDDFASVEDRDIEFILKDFLPIPKKAVTLLSAKGGAGKSWLVLQMALRYINENPNSRVFAWLSEDPNFATKRRAEKIINEILINDPKIKFYDINNPIYINNFKYLGSNKRPFHFIEYDYKHKKINSLFYKLKNTLKDFDFIILDPLIAFFGGDENNNSQAREFMNLLTEWADKEDKAILVVHHNNKSTTGGIRGASAFVDAVRLQYELLTNEDNNKKNNQEVQKIFPSGYRKLIIRKDNWGVEKLIGKKEIEVQIFGEEK